MKTIYIIFFASILAMLQSCESKSEVFTEPVESEVSENVTKEKNNEVTEVDTQENEDLESIKCTGIVDVPPASRISIHSKIKGTVNGIKVIEGQKVRKGELLASITHSELIQLQEDYLKSKIELNYLKEEFKRKELLFNNSSISKKEFLKDKNDYELAKAHFQSLKNQVQYTGLSINSLNNGDISRSLGVYASQSGFIVHTAVNEGDFVDIDRKLFEIIDNSHKHVHLQVFPTDIEKIMIGNNVEFEVAGNSKKYTGKVHLINKMVEDAQKSIGVHVHLDSTYDNLLVGTNVFANINLGK